MESAKQWAWCAISELTSCVQWQHLFQCKDKLPCNIYFCNHQAFMRGILNS